MAQHTLTSGFADQLLVRIHPTKYDGDDIGYYTFEDEDEGSYVTLNRSSNPIPPKREDTIHFAMEDYLLNGTTRELLAYYPMQIDSPGLRLDNRDNMQRAIKQANLWVAEHGEAE